MEAEELLLTEFLELYPDDAAHLLEQAAATEAAGLLVELPAETAASLVRRTAPFAGRELFALMPPDAAGSILDAMPVKTVAGYLRRMNPDLRERLLDALSEESAGAVSRLLSYPEGTAGSVMDPLAPVLTADFSAGQALERIRREPKDVYYYLYVVDREHRLVGVFDLKELMMADPTEPVSSIMHREVVMVRAGMDLTSLVLHPGWHDLDALPVVDEQGVFLGMIRQQLVRKIEPELAGRRPGAAEWGVVMGLAELCWIGMREVTELLAVPLTAPLPEASTPDKGASV